MTWWTSEKLQPKVKSKFLVVFGESLFLPNVKSITKPKVEFDTKEYTLLNHKFNYPGNGTWQPIDVKFVDMNGLGNDTFDTAAFLWQMLNNTGYAYPYLDNDSSISTNNYYKNIYLGKVSTTHGHHIATKINFRDNPKTTGSVEGRSWRNLTTPEKSSTIANSFGGGLLGAIDNKKAGIKRQKVSIYQISPQGEDENGKGATITEAWHLVNPIIKTIDWGDLAYDSDESIEYTLNIIYDWAIYDREIIGSSTSEIGYDAGSYQKFMKQWNLTQDSIDTEIRRGEADVKAALDKLNQIRDRIQTDDRLNADGTAKNDTLEKAEQLYKDNLNPYTDKSANKEEKKFAASKNEYYEIVQDIFDEEKVKVLQNEDGEDVFDIDGDGQISDAEQFLADTGDTDVFTRAAQTSPSISGDRAGDSPLPKTTDTAIIPRGETLNEVPIETSTDSNNSVDTTPSFQQDSSPFQEDTVSGTSENREDSGSIVDIARNSDEVSDLMTQMRTNAAELLGEPDSGGSGDPLQSAHEKHMQAFEETQKEYTEMAKEYGIDTDKGFKIGTRTNTQGEVETTITGIDKDGNPVLIIVDN